MKPIPSPTTEANRAPLRIVTDENGTHRLYRGKEYLGVASLREVELFNSRAALLSACEAAATTLEDLSLHYVGEGSRDVDAKLQLLRAAIASARKEHV